MFLGVVDGIGEGNEKCFYFVKRSLGYGIFKNMARKRFKLKSLMLPLVVFLVAAGARVLYLFCFTDFQAVAMDWYGDVYHHWQIAYLSKEIGFKQGFLRLWDLKGMEYYWGLLHPLLLILGFVISGSYNILVAKIISIIFGSLVVCLII